MLLKTIVIRAPRSSMGVVDSGKGVFVGSGVSVGIEVFVEDGMTVIVGVDTSVTVGRSVVGGELHPVIQEITIDKIKISGRRI